MRPSTPSTAPSLACRSSNFTRSACIEIASPNRTFQHLLRESGSELLLEPGPLLDQCVEVGSRQARSLLPELPGQGVELPHQRPCLQRPTGVHVRPIRIGGAVLGLDAVEPCPGL